MAVLNVQLAERGSHSCCEVGTPAAARCVGT
eukprot:COSAG01_NODE_8928_length_2611_cov_1.805732_5_plen_30_part_01